MLSEDDAFPAERHDAALALSQTDRQQDLVPGASHAVLLEVVCGPAGGSVVRTVSVEVDGQTLRRRDIVTDAGGQRVGDTLGQRTDDAVQTGALGLGRVRVCGQGLVCVRREDAEAGAGLGGFDAQGRGRVWLDGGHGVCLG